jgi:hypothetical protein
MSKAEMLNYLKRLDARLRNLRGVPALKAGFRSPFALRSLVRDRFAKKRIRYEFTVAAIFKDEAPFLEEWLTFHHGIGATQFYLYDNNSTDHFRDVLELVTLTPWPEYPGQRSAYLHCIRSRWKEAEWIAFLDVDEFLFSPRQVDIRPILRGYRDVPALYVYLLNFGSSGHQRRPALPVTEAYTWREPEGVSDSGSSIVNPRYVRNVPNTHVFALWWGRTVNCSRMPVSSPGNRKPGDGSPSYDLLRAHHYWSKSREDLVAKTARGDAFFGGGPRPIDYMLSRESKMNAVQDTSIVPIWRKIWDRNRVAGFEQSAENHNSAGFRDYVTGI